VKLLKKIELPEWQFYEWKNRYGKPNEHNGKQPKDFWLLDEEKEAILEYAAENPLSGYRRMCYEMIDAGVAAVSPTTVFRLLRDNGLMNRFKSRSPSQKGRGFEQPLKAHEHWHIDISYLNICGTFYYLCSILDGYSRKITGWGIGEKMTEKDVEIIVQAAQEKYPTASPRIISDNGSQFIAKDFKEFVRILGMTHVRTSPYYPQSNGKIERWHRSLKSESIRQKVPLSLAEAVRIVGEYIEEYNGKRLHSAIGWITPNDKLAGKSEEIWRTRDEKLAKSRAARSQTRKNKVQEVRKEQFRTACEN
jgi:transposase InsO family protein